MIKAEEFYKRKMSYNKTNLTTKAFQLYFNEKVIQFIKRYQEKKKKEELDFFFLLFFIHSSHSIEI